MQENHISEQQADFSEDVNGEDRYNPSESGDGSIIEEEVPVPEVVDEVPNDSPMVVESSSKVEEVPKKSYASIVSFHPAISIFSANLFMLFALAIGCFVQGRCALE